MLGSFQASQSRTPRGAKRWAAANAKSPNQPARSGRRDQSGKRVLLGTAGSAAQAGVPHTVNSTFTPRLAAASTTAS